MRRPTRRYIRTTGTYRESLDFSCRETGQLFVLGLTADAQRETEMTHTLHGADRAAHFRILAIAMAGAVVVALVGMHALSDSVRQNR